MANTNVFGTLQTAITALVAEVNALRADVVALRANQAKVVTDLTALRTKYEAHVHGGITAGAADSAVRGVANAADALTCAAPAAITSNVLENLAK